MTVITELAAEVMRDAHMCGRCGHRRDMHVRGIGECCRVKADATQVGGPYRCPCRGFRHAGRQAGGIGGGGS